MKQMPRLVAILIIIVLYAFTKPFQLSKSERLQLASEFKFEKASLYTPSNLTPVGVRDVHPQYEQISTWISSVGASVCFIDYDNDKLLNDAVNIDPRYNKVFVAPLPGTGSRFNGFELAPKSVQLTPDAVATALLSNDFNDDGRMDVVVLYFGRAPILFYQQADGSFIDAPLTTKDKYNTASATVADFDGDGHADIFLGNYFPNESNLYDAKATDKDQIMQHSMSRGDNGARNCIFLWKANENGVSRFEEAKDWDKNLPYPYDWTLAVAAADLNNDLMPDLYIANDFGPDKLLINTTKNGKVSFREIVGQKKFFTTRSNVIGHDSFKGMGAEFTDINNDGFLDIYASNIADDFALHESHFVFVNTGETALFEKGLAPFNNESEKLGLSRSSWGWDSRMADFNNDGTPEAVQATGFVKGTVNRWPELQELATTNDELLTDVRFWPRLTPGDDISGNAHVPFFVKHSSGKYFDLAKEIGIDENQITRGIAVGDVNHDGKLDFVTAGQWEDSRLYKNTGTTNRPFIGISLKYNLAATPISAPLIDTDNGGASKFAVGAVARINLKNGKKLIRFVDGGNGHAGRNSPELHFSFEEGTIQDAYDIQLEWRTSKGEVKKATISLTQGWHTVYLPY